MLHKYYEIERWVKRLKEEREDLEKRFSELPLTVEVFQSDAKILPGTGDGCGENI